MSTDIQPPAFPQPDKSGDSIGRGCLYGCLCQAAFIALGYLLVYVIARPAPKLGSALFAGWGVTQWIGIVPWMLQQRQRGNQQTVRGLIIAGSLGLLLSTACAVMVFGN